MISLDCTVRCVPYLLLSCSIALFLLLSSFKKRLLSFIFASLLSTSLLITGRNATNGRTAVSSGTAASTRPCSSHVPRRGGLQVRLTAAVMMMEFKYRRIQYVLTTLALYIWSVFALHLFTFLPTYTIYYKLYHRFICTSCNNIF